MRDSLSLPIPASGDGVAFPRWLRKPVAELRTEPWCLFPGNFALFANPFLIKPKPER